MEPHPPSYNNLITLFLCGDVMTGRGIDQVLPHPSNPAIYESFMKSALGYVEIAEDESGLISKPVDFPYIWGDSLSVLTDIGPDLRIINLETSVTTCSDYWLNKGINYRMHPENIGCLSAAKIDCCILANNHVLDWGYGGLVETLDVLQQAGIKSVGAGKDLRKTETAELFDIVGKGRLVVLAYGSKSSGIPASWSPTEKSPGVNLLPDFSDNTILQIKKVVEGIKQPGDVVLFSIHWGGNWGYVIPREDREFAHRLIDEAYVDAIYGHSSHHVKGIEVYKGKLILYGCGDFLNDYEGISGYELFRDDLSLMYFPRFDPATGSLAEMIMAPMQIRHFRTNYASQKDCKWLMKVLNREGKKFGTQVTLSEDGYINLIWD
jgi:poly-gamma-glutamate capsule biosynthesis protein CapA/YwtB (metallophosphatase superfamily)